MAQQPSRQVLEWIKQQHAEAGEASRKGRKARVKPRNSLEDVLQHDPVSFGRTPWQISLPESRDESSTAGDGPDGGIDPGERDANAAKPSLEMFDRDDALVLPASTPLPPSPPPSPTQEPTRPQTSQEPHEELPPPLFYQNVLERAAKVFDHIRNGNVLKETRVKGKTSIKLYEYYDNNTSWTKEIKNSKMIFLHRNPTEGLKRRVFIVEDLSPDTIHALGRAFTPTPEFFEEHLLNSGYGGPQYDDPPAQLWKTAGLTKSYASIQWFRPMHRPPPLFSIRDREDLLQVKGEGLVYVSGESHIAVKAGTNIFRSEWDLCTDPRATAQDTRELGLVERASIWRKNDKNLGYEAVIVLLDPLPTIQIRSRKPSEPDNDRVDVNKGNDSEGDGNDGQVAIPTGNPQRVTTERSELRWLSRQRNRVVHRREANVKTSFQVLVKEMAPRKAITIDLDQAFLKTGSLTMLQERLNETRSTRQEVQDILDRQGTTDSLLDILFEIIRQDTSTLLRVLSRILDDMDIDILDDTKMEDRLALWRQLIGKAERELSDLKVSTKGFLDFFGVPHPTDPSLATADDHQVVRENVSNLFEEIDQMLERLRRASASLTSNMGILDSRRSIEEAHAVTRLTELAFIFIPLSFSSSVFGMQVEPFEDPVPMWNFFVAAIAVTAFAYTMRMTMRSQWLASQKQKVKQDIRQYAELHSLPVQVHSPSNLLLLQWLGSTLKRSASATWVWTTRRSRKAAKHLWQILGFPISFIVIIGIAVAPITMLWTRHLDSGVQGTVTAVIVFALLGLVVPYWRSCDRDFRYAFPNYIMGLVRRIPPTTRSLLLWVSMIAVFVAIPLPLIWTRPLASGIKAGLTAALLVILVTGIGYQWMRRLNSRATAFSVDLSSGEESNISAESVVQGVGMPPRR